MLACHEALFYFVMFKATSLSLDHGVCVAYVYKFTNIYLIIIAGEKLRKNKTEVWRREESGMQHLIFKEPYIELELRFFA